MPSLADDTASQLVNKLPGATVKTVKAGKTTIKGSWKGICLTFKMGKFGLKGIIKAMKKFLDMTHEGQQYSSKNISMKALQEKGNVVGIEVPIMQGVMKPLDKLCRKYGIKYTAMYDKSKNEYYMFFNAKNTDIVNTFFKKATEEYFANEAKKEKATENGKEADAGSRSSVRGKINFFRSWAKKYNESREKMKGKHREEKTL